MKDEFIHIEYLDQYLTFLSKNLQASVWLIEEFSDSVLLTEFLTRSSTSYKESIAASIIIKTAFNTVWAHEKDKIQSQLDALFKSPNSQITFGKYKEGHYYCFVFLCNLLHSIIDLCKGAPHEIDGFFYLLYSLC